jgi:hypothetical protein
VIYVPRNGELDLFAIVIVAWTILSDQKFFNLIELISENGFFRMTIFNGNESLPHKKIRKTHKKKLVKKCYDNFT